MTAKEQPLDRIGLEWKYLGPRMFFLTIDRVNPELQDLRPTPNLEKWTDAHEK